MDRRLTFSGELKKHRQARQISLLQIANATRINIKFLEAIESGNFEILPQPYIRAFLREYAEAIGLDPSEVVARYGEALRSAEEPEPAAPSEPHSHRDEEEEVAPSASSVILPLLQKNLVPILAVLTGLIIVLYVYSDSSTEIPLRGMAEIPFDLVLKENEAAVAAEGRGQSVSPHTATRSGGDSLRLEIQTIDTLWIRITIDGERSEEYLFPPQRRRAWTAQDHFSITMGNAGAATFRLNGRELGSPGARGAVVRDVAITERGFQEP